MSDLVPPNPSIPNPPYQSGDKCAMVLQKKNAIAERPPSSAGWTPTAEELSLLFDKFAESCGEGLGYLSDSLQSKLIALSTSWTTETNLISEVATTAAFEADTPQQCILLFSSGNNDGVENGEFPVMDDHGNVHSEETAMIE